MYNGMFIMVKTRGLDAEGIQAGGRIVERVSPFHDGKEQAVEGVRIANGSNLPPYDPNYWD